MALAGDVDKILEGVKATTEGKNFVAPAIAAAKVSERENKGLLTRLGDIPLLGDAAKSLPVVGETLSDVPIGFQVGTWLGLEGAPALVTDLLLDPTLYLGGFGAASKAAGASRLAGRVARKPFRNEDLLKAAINGSRTFDEVVHKYSKHVDKAARLDATGFEALEEVIRKNPGRGAAGALNEYISRVKSATKKVAKGGDGTVGLKEGDVLAGELAGKLPNGVDLNRVVSLSRVDPEQALSFIRGEVAKRKEVQTRLQKVMSGEIRNPKEVNRIFRDVKKLHPSQKNELLLGKDNLRAMKDMYNLEQAGRTPTRMAASLGDQARLPSSFDDVQLVGESGVHMMGTSARQRSILNLGLPFSGAKRQNVLSGQPIFDGIDTLTSKFPALRRRQGNLHLVAGNASVAAKIDRDIRTAMPAANAITVNSAMSAATDMFRGIDKLELNARSVAEMTVAERNMAAQGAKLVENEIRLARLGLLKGEGFKVSDFGAPSASARARGMEIDTMLFDAMRGRASKHFDIQGGQIVKRQNGAPFKVTDEIAEMADTLVTNLRHNANLIRKNGALESVFRKLLPMLGKVRKVDDLERFLDAKVAKAAEKIYATAGSTKDPLPMYDLLEEAAEQGLISLKSNPKDIATQYMAATADVLADRRFVDRAMGTRVSLTGDTDDFMPAIFPKDDFDQLVKEKPEIKKFYKRVRNSNISGMGTKKVTKKNGEVVEKEGVVRPFSKGAWVHKEAATMIDNILDAGVGSKRGGEKLGDKALRNMVAFNAFRKRALLSMSVFHAVALTESGFASVGSPFLGNVKAIGQGRFSRGVGMEDVVKQATGYGLTLGKNMNRDDSNVYIDALKHAESKLRRDGDRAINGLVDQSRAQAQDIASKTAGIAADGIGGVRRLGEAWDNALWENYHSGMKLMAFNELLYRGIRNNPTAALDEVGQATAQHVNNAFGGQVWERFWGGSKTGQQLARLALLAPDWTVSNLAIAWDVFANMIYRGANLRAQIGAAMKGEDPTKLMEVSNISGKNLFQILTGGGATFRGDDILKSDIRAQFARQYAKRATIAMMGAANVANYAFTGKFMGDNPEGRRGDIATGWKNANRQPVFLSVGKQFKEPFEAMEDPIHFLQKKKSTIVSDVVSMAAGVDVFGRPIYGREDGPLMKGMKIGGHLMGGFFPIGVQNFWRNSEGVLDADLGQLGIEAASGIGVPVRAGVPVSGSSGGGNRDVNVPNSLFTQGRLRQLQRARLSVPGS